MSSTRYCSSCSMDVKIGLGGEAHWEVHLKSSAHIRSEQATAQKISASHFFSKFLPKSRDPPASTSSAVMNLCSMISPELFDHDNSGRAHTITSDSAPIDLADHID